MINGNAFSPLLSLVPRCRPLPSMRRGWGCFITAGPLRTDRSEATPLSAHTSFGPQSRVDLPDVAATGAHATYV
jgi:hypothetical protein